MDQKPIIKWLLDGEPWVQYRTRLDLLDQQESELEVMGARKVMLGHPLILALLQELKAWPGQVISSHKSAGQPYHKLSFIADLGMKKDDPEMGWIIAKILEHRSDEGPFQLPTNIPECFGGSGQDKWAWALCDAPTILYSLARFGMGDNDAVKEGANYLVGLVRDNGWPCAVSQELGKFRGPGNKNDPCPYATLIMLKMLLQFSEWREGKEAHLGAESLLSLWKDSRLRHPYMFYMGTDFRKAKAPFIWYDLLHVSDVLTQCKWLRKDERLVEMVNILKVKADSEGRFTPESEWKAWKGWDFGQKKVPSRWLTLLYTRLAKRMEYKW
ncbi:MAG: hypothetical protein LUP94_00115, partial [Candidatus Methanomethylicus sp.]|nr:hypothetical protein [Candidatus Methanomethylicus sp.]